MGSTKELRDQINSLGQTRKITSAMERIAATKMRKAQLRMKASRPYATKMRELAARLSSVISDYVHPFFVHHNEAQRICFIVISSDKGLCGGLNTNLFRPVLKAMKEAEKQGKKPELFVVGLKALQFFKRINARITNSLSGFSDKSTLDDILGPILSLISDYLKGELCSVVLCYNKFISAMKQEPILDRLLPLAPLTELAAEDYIFEPAPQVIIDEVLTRCIESTIYQAAIENYASEQSARMVAMRAATDNTNSIQKELKLLYNKMRQAAITKELAEIMAGAAAV